MPRIPEERSCKFCQKIFASTTSLKDHLRNHLGEFPFSCQECGKSYSNRRSLRYHAGVHRSEGKKAKPKNSVCTFCEKRFALPKDLVRHIRVHTGERPYNCEVCGKSFKMKGTLKGHSYIHMNKTLQCAFCEKSFSVPENLRNHTIRHTGEKTYCKICGKGLANGRGLRAHAKVHN